MRRRLPLALLVALVAGLAACGGDPPEFERALSPVRAELTYLKDEEGRYVFFHGVNVGGSTKVPKILDVPLPSGRDFTYVGRPFPLEEADRWFGQLQALGFNAIRLLFLWEAVFPEERGKPDTEFLDYFEAIIAKANEHGIYVLVNMHENLWGRHLYANFNRAAPGTRGDIENMLLSLLPCHPDRPDECDMDKVVGDGAPLWATKACLPEKQFDSPHFGTHHLVGTLARDDYPPAGSDALAFVKLVAGELGFEISAELEADVQARLAVHGAFDYTESSDMLPLSGWWENTVISLDVGRCYAAFFGGDKVFPNTVVDVDGQVKNRADAIDADKALDLKEYLQGSYTDAWVEIAKRGAKYPNVIGYDIMNEPSAGAIMFTVVAAYFTIGFDGTVKDLLNLVLPIEIGDLVGLLDTLVPWIADPTKGPCEEQCELPDNDYCGPPCDELCGGAADATCAALCGQQRASCTKLVRRQETTCTEFCRDPDRDQAATKLFYLLKYLEMLPPDTSDETKRKWGMSDVDFFAAFGLNDAFDVFYLQPLFERVGKAIQAVHPGAGIWIEPTGGGSLQGETYMTVPPTLTNVVFTPHWYPDIYPFLGFNQPERDFSPDEVRFRDYTNDLRTRASASTTSLSNVPVVFGEFGTYWNYKYKGEDWEELGAVQSRRNEYRVSAEILDNYYEAFETLFASRFLWCYTTDNDAKYGDGWNREDFSVIDENQEPRGWQAWLRPHARALSGKPVSTHFYSDLHYFDPDKGEPDAVREFEVIFASKETDAPSILFVPTLQYPDGFYVWLSDGWATWDAERQLLFYHPQRDEPDWQHRVLVRPPIAGQDITGWKYFVRGDRVVVGG